MSSTDVQQWFERIVYALVMRADDTGGPDAPAEVVAMGQDAAVLRVPRADSRVLLLRYLPERGRDLATRLREDVTRLAHAPLEVALIGGPPGAHTLLEDAKPRFTRKPVSLYHLRDDGTLWQSGARMKRGSALATALVPPPGPWPPPEDDRARFATRLEAQLAAANQEQQEIGSFSAVLRSRRPVATWALAGIIGLVFVLQTLWDATGGGPALVRMGAFVPERIRDGEWWRLMSATFLHAGLAHMAINMFVLVRLGTVLERILGTSRFLVLYGAAALAGSLASFVPGDERISVGASGALWGLLVAEAVLAFRPRGLLPAAMIAQAKRAAAANMILNVGVSFLPQVAMAAHFGGGAMGLLLLGTGVLTAGLRPLPRAADTSSEDHAATAPGPDEPATEPTTAPGSRKDIAFAAGAVVVVAVLIAGLALGLVRGRAWALDDAPALTRRAVPALGLAVALPAELPARDTSQGDDATTAVFGSFPSDPAVVELMRVPMEPLPAEQLEAEIAGLVTALADAPGAGRVLAAPERFQAAGQPAVRVVYELQNDLILERGVVLTPDHLLRVDVVIWPAYRAAYGGLATRIIESLQPLASP